jgi:hypothetical protein
MKRRLREGVEFFKFLHERKATAREMAQTAATVSSPSAGD